MNDKPLPLSSICSDLEKALDALEDAQERRRDHSRLETAAKNEIIELEKDVQRLRALLDEHVKTRVGK